MGAASDVGRKHQINQDAVSIAVRSGRHRIAVVAVGDGVTSAPGSERAAQAAAQAAVDRVVRHVDEPAESIHSALSDAFADAHEAVLRAAEAGEEPAATTLILAVVRIARIWVANVGDTRAYWLGDDGSSRLLSTDDSMAQARIQLGVSREAAERSAMAHAITKWLGRSATDVSPTIQMIAPESDGWFVACSDGLWNYASSPELMRSLVERSLRHARTPVALAEALVDWAVASGGRDNVTAAVVRYRHDLTVRSGG